MYDGGPENIVSEQLLSLLQFQVMACEESRTNSADSGRADDETEVLLEDWSDDLQEDSNVVEHVSKQPDNTQSLAATQRAAQ